MKTSYLNGRSIYEYINRSARYRNELKEVVYSIQTHLPETVVFGGMIRDFELGNAKYFQSDVDMVSNVDIQTLYQVIKKYNPYRNKYGGYRFKVGRWVFDIWPLSNTWAFKEGLVEGSGFESLLKTTFFNIDSAYIKIGENKICVSEDFRVGLEQRILDINLKINPCPQRMVRRAIRLSSIHNLGLSYELLEYVLQQPGSRHTINEQIYQKMKNHFSTSDKPYYMQNQLEFDFYSDFSV